MRAIYYPFESKIEEKTLVVEGVAAHHLNVVRTRKGEAILLLNGKGSLIHGTVLDIQKNSVEIQIVTTEVRKRTYQLSLAVANPKKDAFEDILKLAVELGISHIYPLSSDFSQYDYVPSERIQRVLESALIQSNNPYFPEIKPQTTLSTFLSEHQETIVFFNSKRNEGFIKNDKDIQSKTILIGPEGGFSPTEVGIILKYGKVQEIHLPTPILRAPTAVASSVGYLLALENKPQ